MIKKSFLFITLILCLSSTMQASYTPTVDTPSCGSLLIAFAPIVTILGVNCINYYKQYCENYCIEQIQKNNKKIINDILEKGDPNKLMGGKALIHYVIKHCSNDSIKQVIKHPKVDINCKDSQGNTPLLYAINRTEHDSNLYPLKLLLENPQVNVSCIIQHPTSALYFLVLNWRNYPKCNKSIAQMLFERGIVDEKNDKYLLHNLFHLNADDFQFLLNLGAAKELLDENDTLLHYAIDCDDVNKIKYLLEKDSSLINYIFKGEEQFYTPIEYCLKHNRYYVFADLMEFGADLTLNENVTYENLQLCNSSMWPLLKDFLIKVFGHKDISKLSQTKLTKELGYKIGENVDNYWSQYFIKKWIIDGKGVTPEEKEALYLGFIDGSRSCLKRLKQLPKQDENKLKFCTMMINKVQDSRQFDAKNMLLCMKRTFGDSSRNLAPQIMQYLYPGYTLKTLWRSAEES